MKQFFLEGGSPTLKDSYKVEVSFITLFAQCT